MLLALSILTPYFQYIPKAALSAVIISAVIFMIEYEVVQPLWRCSRRELLPGAVTFILSLTVGVEIGLLAGVTTDLAFVIHRTARPVLSIEKAEVETYQNIVSTSVVITIYLFTDSRWPPVRNYPTETQPLILSSHRMGAFEYFKGRDPARNYTYDSRLPKFEWYALPIRHNI